MEKVIEKTIAALTKNGFEVEYFEKGKDAREAALQMIPKGASIGVSGSVTIHQIGLFDAAANGGFIFHNPYQPDISREESIERRRLGLTADFFLTGTNAITENGKLVNIDGFGNRVSAHIFGPKKVLMFASTKKIVSDVHKALERVKKIAAPLNAKRLNKKTGCAAGKSCADCPPDQTMCNVTVILEHPGVSGRIKIFLIGEDLGY